MFTEEKQYTCVPITIRSTERSAANHAHLQPEQNIVEFREITDDRSRLFEFAATAPATYAERFPRLMVCVVSAAVLLAAITAEIECLRGSGYYW